MLLKIVRRDVLCSFHKILSRPPVAFGIKEIFSDGRIRYLVSDRKSYDHNAMIFDHFSDLDSYISSKGWI